MKIALFTEIYDRGGVDTFLASLVRNWPDPADEFVVIANASYPGLEVVEKKLEGSPARIERHRLRTYPDLLASLSEGGRAVFFPQGGGRAGRLCRKLAGGGDSRRRQKTAHN